MKYSVSYEISDDSGGVRHTRYYDALTRATALEMFQATCEESLAGEDPSVLEVKRLTKEDEQDNS